VAADLSPHPAELAKDASELLVRNFFTACDRAAGTAPKET